MDIKNMTGISEEIVNYISEFKKEPVWMRNMRLSAWSLYSENPAPVISDESWLRTDISALNFENITPFNSGRILKPDSQLELENGNGSKIVQYDSSVVFAGIDKDLKNKGVIFTDMDSALVKYPDLVTEYFMKSCVIPKYNVLTLLHASSWSGGVFLYVPSNVEIDVPFNVIYNLSRYGMGMFQHTLIIVENSSIVTFNEQLLSSIDSQQSKVGNSRSLSNGVVEIFLKDNAKLNYSSIQSFSANVNSFNTKRALVGRDSSINWVEGMVGAGLEKNHLEVALRGSGSNADITGISFLTGEQHLDTWVSIHHTVPNTTGNILINSVVDESAKSVFQGMIRIDPDAQHTDSFMGNYNLLLGDNAKADSIPRLEIEADEVRATHGVTVGQVDEEQLFYLMSRGINKDDAKDMIVDGFFESLISRVQQKQTQDDLRYSLQRKREQ